jgi:hypothetical protein
VNGFAALADSKFIRLVAPGQIGTISQGQKNWREVRCHTVNETEVFFTLVKGYGEGEIDLSRPSVFQVIGNNGILRCEGSLVGLDIDNENYGLKFSPGDKPHEVINRRQSFRVGISMRATLNGSALFENQNYDQKWECALRDISIGGVKLVLASPPPARGSQAMIELDLATESQPLLVPCIIVDSIMEKTPPPMDVVVRIAFHALTSHLEGVLSKYVNWVQLDMLKKGIR